MTRTYTALGMMSGTSMDGVDAAIIISDGKDRVEAGPSAFMPYSAGARAAIESAIEAALDIEDRFARPSPLADAEREITNAHIAAISNLVSRHELSPDSIDVVGFHGQTILHAPERALTIQLGNGNELARACGIDVVYDFRATDMLAGGEGAPLVPVYHRALSAGIPERPLAVLNIGGVSNLTWIGRDDALCAFDIGPGNALLDDWMRQHTELSFDRGGETALRGIIDETALQHLLAHPYFGKKPPKSLDRNAFSLEPLQGLSLEDGAATLVAFTSAAIAATVDSLPEKPSHWIVCGGGAKNHAIMQALKNLLDGSVATGNDHGFEGDFVEAQAFAYMAIRSIEKLPLTFPATTGVASPQTGGRYCAAV